MEDACYICHRTRTDVDRLNEEIRTRVYLEYFTNTRNQVDHERRRIVFLQRLKDEESSDPHFRINAGQVFGDPPAYEKLMPWIDRLIEIAHARGGTAVEKRTIGELVDHLLAEEKQIASALEQGLDQLRGRIATNGKLPISLDEVKLTVPAEWSMDGSPAKWQASQPSDIEPLHPIPGDSRSSVEVTVHLCTICRQLTKAL
ncbi:MAG TPA: hypothetical protein VEG66_06545 [Thermoplasmata archaeon]|jgi:hypothetical protein|nr:hypothetical protein [Thermoplasmata archaeon]